LRLSFWRRTIKAVIPYLTLIIALLFQTTAAPFLKIGLIHPDLVLIVVFSWVILRGLDDGLFITLFGGLGIDFFSGVPFGIFTVALIIPMVITNTIHERLFSRNSLVLPTILIIPANFLWYTIVILLLTLLGRPIDWNEMMALIVIPATLLNAITLTVLYWPIYLLNRLLDPPPDIQTSYIY